MLASLVIWNLNIAACTTLKYCHKYALNKKLKLMGGAMKCFLKKLVNPTPPPKKLLSKSLALLELTIYFFGIRFEYKKKFHFG